MKLKIYGSGCAKCNQLAANTETAAQAMGLNYELEKVTDMNGIIDAGVMRTPALAMDDEIIVEGRVAKVEEIQKKLA